MHQGDKIMGCFKRAEWRSGLTYEQTCRTCGNVMRYMDNILDFRPWYPDGFVYCTKCNSPLRHNELYAINAPAGPVAGFGTPVASEGEKGKFCSNCGRKFGDAEKFCPECGTKR